MKNVFIFFSLFLSFFICINYAEANSIKSIDMSIYIDKYGNASVEEVWDVFLNKGTEGYKTYSDLKEKIISNFKVIDDNGITYQSLPFWDVSSSFEEKAYKSGINKTYNGAELCWGISKYGNRSYRLSYTIENIVEQYNDNQAIYFNFLNLDQKVGNVNIEINSDIMFDDNNSKIWGFGYDGNIIFNNGKIILNTDKLSANDYMVALIKFETNLFNTSNYVNKTFADIYDEVFSEVDISNDYNTSKLSIIKRIISYIIMIVISFLKVFLIIIFGSFFFVYTRAFLFTIISNFLKKIFPNNNLEYSRSIKMLKKNKFINYYREIPCNKDIELAYFILNKLNIIKTKELKKGIIGAFILKWLKLSYIKVDKHKKSLIINRDIYKSIWKKELSLDSKYENKLYMILYQASNNDYILNPKEFKIWSRKNYKILNSWYTDMLINKKSEVEHLIISSSEKKFFGGTVYYRMFGEKLMNEAYNLIGLKKFLLDFSNMKDKTSIEVELWEYYLIFATLFGITDKIDSELKDLYPDLNVDEYIKFNEILNMIDEFSDSSYRGMRTSININNFRQDFDSMFDKLNEGGGSSSGSGGRSFSSGGSSSGGSSGGGFR